jgi:hypothetical protein
MIPAHDPGVQSRPARFAQHDPVICQRTQCVGRSTLRDRLTLTRDRVSKSRALGEEIDRTQLQIGEFAELVGLSVPQLRRYDRLRLLEPATRSADSRYRYYSPG